MGSISEILNHLGYGQDSDEKVAEYYSNEISATSASKSSKNANELPRGYLKKGVCAGCELSARYF